MPDENQGSVTSLILALERAGYEDILVLDDEDYNSILSSRKKDILDTLTEEESLSVSDLAEKLGRKKSAVSRDLGELYEYNVINFETDGRKKIPVLKHEIMIAKPYILTDNSNHQQSVRRDENDKVEASPDQDGVYKYGSEITDAINDLRTKDNRGRAILYLDETVESHPDHILPHLSLLEDVVVDNPELVNPAADIVETLSTTHPDKIPDSLYTALLNKGMGKKINRDVRLTEKDDGSDL